MKDSTLMLISTNHSVIRKSLLTKPELAVVDPVFFQAMERFSELIKSALELNGAEVDVNSELIKQGANLYFRFSCDTSGLVMTNLTYICETLGYVEQLELIPVKRQLLRIVVTVKATISPEAYKRAIKEIRIDS